MRMLQSFIRMGDKGQENFLNTSIIAALMFPFDSCRFASSVKHLIKCRSDGRGIVNY